MHNTSEIVRENAYGIVSRARWVYLSTSLRNLSRAFRRVKDRRRVYIYFSSGHLALEIMLYHLGVLKRTCTPLYLGILCIKVHVHTRFGSGPNSSQRLNMRIGPF